MGGRGDSWFQAFKRESRLKLGSAGGHKKNDDPKRIPDIRGGGSMRYLKCPEGGGGALGGWSYVKTGR